MELSNSTSLTGAMWVDISFLFFYCGFVLLNILAIVKFANRNELLTTFIMLTSLTALLRNFLCFTILCSTSDDPIPSIGAEHSRREALGLLLLQLRDSIPYFQSCCFPDSSIMVRHTNGNDLY